MVHLPEQQLAPLVRPPPFGDVAGDLGRANDFASRVPDWRNGQGYIDEASVLAPPNRFVVLDPFAAADALEDHRFLIFQIARYENGDRPADHFPGRIAEQPLRAVVPAGDHAIEVFGQDRVFGGLDNRSVVLCGAIVWQTITARACKGRRCNFSEMLRHCPRNHCR